MKPITALVSSLLPLLSLASPSLTPRQDSQVRITAITTSGPGCAAGTIATNIDPSGLAATIGFDAYQASVGPGVPGSEREKHCELFLTLRFPLGCTRATVTTTHHGFALLESGVTGVAASTYNISPGSLTGSNPPSTFLSGPDYVSGDAYEKNDAVGAQVTVNGAGQRDVSYVVRSRLFVTSPGGSQEGIITADDVTVAISGQTSC